MIKTITIKTNVQKTDCDKGKDESFSDLFQKQLEGNYLSGIDALKKLRGDIEFDRDDKDIILKDNASNRDERRI